MATRLAAILVSVIVATTLIAGLIVGAQRDDNSGPVDLIIHNAKVYAADDLGSIADAVAIRGNKILKVGSEREVMRYRQPQTSIIDAHGAAVLPGFDDAHVSLVDGGLARDGVQLHGAATLDDIQSRVTDWVTARPGAAWVTGGGWSYDAFADQPSRAQLDAAVPDRPALLLSEDGHSLWVNSKALQAAGITRKTRNPKNGIIVRDRRGDATGVLKGAAMALVDRVVPPPTREERAKALELAMREANRAGITSVQDLGAAAGDLDLYDAARDAGTLTLRVYAAASAGRTSIDDLDAIAKRFPDDPMLKTGLASIVLDGSVESETAAMLTPYARKGAGAGLTQLEPAELSSLVASLDAHGWQVAIDAAGDASVRAALDAFGAVAKSAAGARPPRHRIENVSVIDPEDIPRFGALGIVASMQPLHATLDGLTTWAKALGPDRVPFGWPARSISGAGGHLAFGSDWPVMPLEPLDAIRAAVRRPNMHAGEALTLKSAINAWTSGAAWASFDDHRKGTLKPGMLADLVILSTDIFKGSAQFTDAEVVMTVFDGKVVYKRAS
jgi:predicted amidohydrolase YtcJ